MTLVLLAGPWASVWSFHSPRNRNIKSGNEEKPHDGGMEMKAGALEDSDGFWMNVLDVLFICGQLPTVLYIWVSVSAAHCTCMIIFPIVVVSSWNVDCRSLPHSYVWLLPLWIRKAVLSVLLPPCATQASRVKCVKSMSLYHHMSPLYQVGFMVSHIICGLWPRRFVEELGRLDNTMAVDDSWAQTHDRHPCHAADHYGMALLQVTHGRVQLGAETAEVS